MKILISLFTIFAFYFFSLQIPKKNFQFSKITPKFTFSYAQASTAQTLLNQVESLYELIEGGEGQSTANGGLMDFINTIVTNLGSGLYTAGYQNCLSIPKTGSEQITDSQYTYDLVFEPGVKTIPSHFFQGAGETLENRIEVSAESNEFMTIEFTCNDSGFSTGYFRYYEFDAETDRDADSEIFTTTNADALADPINIETYFQYDVTKDKVIVDFYLTMITSAGKTRKLATQFETTNGNQFKIWTIQYLDDLTADTVEAVMVSADRDQKFYSINRGLPNSDASDTTDEVSNWSDSECVNNSNGTPDLSISLCTSSSLAKENGHPIQLLGSSQAFTIQNIQNLTLSTIDH
ncbi:MAG: hypothetical protein H6621_10110 [Halobacteriovoraceae bacterium]|nr:hypothetical protein [Halobacteriovoraceae bacterium]MCB9095410.1 hypothetical protein [Halobacteriovoraceae bacterium]